MTKREFNKTHFTVALDVQEAFRAALQDIALFGTGVIATDGHGHARHIAIESLQAFAQASNKLTEDRA